MKLKNPEVSEAGSSERNQQILTIKNAYLQGYERGYKEGRDREFKTQQEYRGFELSDLEIMAITRFALKIGYIDYEKHADFHQLLKRIDAHVRNL